MIAETTFGGNTYFPYFCYIMNDKLIDIKEASVSDAVFVADCVLCAIGLYDFDVRPEQYRRFAEVCRMEDTLYSYRNALIVSVDGVDAGCIVAYPGDNYEEVREKTFKAIESKCGTKISMNYDMETGPGEYYLDSLAVVPSFRGHGLGHVLMKAQIERGRALGYSRLSLIVDKTHPRVRAYYCELGFRNEGEVVFADIAFDRMVLDF